MDDVRNVIIIGSGPAGYTAAIYAARADLEPLVFEGSVTAGGALMNTTDVENFPGFPDGVMGPELMDNLRKQAERFGAELVTDDVTEVDLTGAGQGRHGRRGDRAPGARRRHRHGLRLPRARRAAARSELSGRGVSWCATCDGFFFRDQDIVVVGGGDTAMEEATFLTRFARSRSRSCTAATACAPPRSCRSGRSPTRRSASSGTARSSTSLGDDQGERGAAAQHASPARSPSLDVTGLFVAIGHDPRSELVRGPGRASTTRATSWSTPRRRATNLPGVFACGDVVDHTYRQAITAAGTGCAAALDAERYLTSLEDARPTTGDPAQAVRAAVAG